MRAHIDIGKGEVGLFGYGSLLLLSSMERTLGRPYRRQRHPCHIKGWRRTWDSIYPNQRYYFMNANGNRCFPKNILYLNVTPAEDLLNGVVYVISSDDLADYDKREAVYSRIDIRDALSDADANGPVWMYVGLPEYVLRRPAAREEAAVRRTYVGIVESGLHELGPAFREAYTSSSDPVPEPNVIDDILD